MLEERKIINQQSKKKYNKYNKPWGKKISKLETFAAMDLGTNSNRLLIVNAKGRKITSDVKTVSLGEKLAQTKEFQPQSIERGINSFIHFRKLLDKFGVKHYRAIATAACRMSTNTDEFIKKVKEVSNIKVEVISGFEEARLTLQGAKLNAPKNKKYIFVYDLGGGSTEVTFATNDRRPKIIATISIPLGALNATEMYDLREYDEQKADKLRRNVQNYMNDFLDEIKDYDYKDNTALVATSSTPLRLVSMLNQTQRYDKFLADGMTVSTRKLDELIDEKLKLNFEERKNNIYLGENRARIFIAACIIFRTIFRSLGVKKMTASLKGASEAIVEELRLEEQIWKGR